MTYYKRAADLGDKRAIQRLKGAANQPIKHPNGPGAVLHRQGPGGPDGHNAKGEGKDKDKDCVIM
jgi:uncharacterized protein